MRLELSQPALSDLDNLLIQGMDHFGAIQALDYQNELLDRLDELLEFPLACPVSIFDELMRVCVFRAHIILYEVRGEALKILRVRHQRENWLTADS